MKQAGFSYDVPGAVAIRSSELPMFESGFYRLGGRFEPLRVNSVGQLSEHNGKMIHALISGERNAR